MSFAQFDKAFGKEMLQEAKAYRMPGPTGDPVGVQSYQYSAAKAREMGFYPSDKEVEKRFERLKEKYWSQYKYRVPDWAEDKLARMKAHAADSWHVEEYFRQHGAELSGPYAGSVEKAFQVVPGELTVFPYFWDTQIVEGILAIPLLDILVMDTVTVASGTAVHAVMNETLSDRTMGETGEFDSFQEVNISSTESLVRLKKFGAILTVSDESMRRQRVPIFARGIARIGRQIGIAMTDLAVDIIINGDTAYGGINGAATTVAAGVAGSPTYSDYVTLDMNFDIGYEPTDRVMGRNGIIKLLNIPQFQDPLAGFKFQNQGVLPEALGLQTHRWDSTGSSSWTSGGATGDSTKVIDIQRQRALILYQEGGLSTESDRDLRSESTVVKTSWYLAFGIWDRNAVRIGTGFS